MPREFNRNMFVMLLTIMIGVIIITFFIGDIIRRSDIDTLKTEHKVEIKEIASKNKNFTSNFIISNVILDKAKEGQYSGNYNFNLAYVWYNSALAEKNITNFNTYKIRTIDNCTKAMTHYINSHNNFNLSKNHFNDTKALTDFIEYQEIIDIYIDLSESGYKLTDYRYNASYYLISLTENLIVDTQNGTIIYGENVTEILQLFNDSLSLIEEEGENFAELQEGIDEYDLFKTLR